MSVETALLYRHGYIPEALVKTTEQGYSFDPTVFNTPLKLEHVVGLFWRLKSAVITFDVRIRYGWTFKQFEPNPTPPPALRVIAESDFIWEGRITGNVSGPCTYGGVNDPYQLKTDGVLPRMRTCPFQGAGGGFTLDSPFYSSFEPTITANITETRVDQSFTYAPDPPPPPPTTTVTSSSVDLPVFLRPFDIMDPPEFGTQHVWHDPVTSLYPCNLFFGLQIVGFGTGTHGGDADRSDVTLQYAFPDGVSYSFPLYAGKPFDGVSGYSGQFVELTGTIGVDFLFWQ